MHQNICYFVTFYIKNREPPQLSGFICTFHPAAPGSSPKHTIYAFSFYIVQIVYICHSNWNVKRTKSSKKRPGMAQFYKIRKRIIAITKLLKSPLSHNFTERDSGIQTRIFGIESEHADHLTTTSDLTSIVFLSGILL